MLTSKVRKKVLASIPYGYNIINTVHWIMFSLTRLVDIGQCKFTRGSFSSLHGVGSVTGDMIPHQTKLSNSCLLDH